MTRAISAGENSVRSRSLFPRSSGVLLHPTSLPGPFGVGDLGPSAHRFCDFCAEAKQSIWQMLPIGPTGYADSPYQSFSAFAGNPLLLNLDRLIDVGWLDESIRRSPPPFPNETVDYDRVIPWKRAILAEAYVGFERRATAEEREAFQRYCEASASWLDDFAMFMAIKESRSGANWTQWPVELRMRRPDALAAIRRRLADSIRRHQFEQFEFDIQWRALQAKCREAGVRLMGDMPIYVSLDSSDAWSHPELFEFDEHGLPTVVAGVPPDYFSKTGQLWGNPIYRWAEHERTGFDWWIERFRSLFSRFEMARVDHFRGFEAFWEVPAGEKTAVTGRWVNAPGEALFAAVEKKLGRLAILAENLGLITPEVEELRTRFGFPGMVVVQFGYAGEDEGSLQFRPENYTEDTVAYTGTHDNDTLVGWLEGDGLDATTRTTEQVAEERTRVAEAFGCEGPELPDRIIEAVWQSASATAILPLQDLLKVGSVGRMNRPAIAHGNWRWRFTVDALTAERREWLRNLTVRSKRAPPGGEASDAAAEKRAADRGGPNAAHSPS